MDCPLSPALNLFAEFAFPFSILKEPLGFDIIGVSLPYTSVKTTPN